MAEADVDGLRRVLRHVRPAQITVIEGGRQQVNLTAIMLADATAVGEEVPGGSPQNADSDEEPIWEATVFTMLNDAVARQLAARVNLVETGRQPEINPPQTLHALGVPAGEGIEGFGLNDETLDRLAEFLEARSPHLVVFDTFRAFLPPAGGDIVRATLRRLAHVAETGNSSVLLTQLRGTFWIHRLAREAAATVFRAEGAPQAGSLPWRLVVTDDSDGMSVRVPVPVNLAPLDAFRRGH